MRGRVCRACGAACRAAAPRAPTGSTTAFNSPAIPPPPPSLPPSDPLEAPSLPCLLLYPSHGGGNFPHQIHYHPYRSSPEDHRRTSPTSFSTTPSTSSSPETKEKAIPKLLHLLPQVLHGGTWLDLLQHCPTPTSGPLLVLYSSSVSFPRPHHLPFALVQLHSLSMDPF
jgi:hypothetical protein